MFQTTLQVPNEVPFDSKGQVMPYRKGQRVGKVNRETGEIFFPGQDFDVELPDGTHCAYKDEETRRKLINADDLVADAEMVPNVEFFATLHYDTLAKWFKQQYHVFRGDDGHSYYMFSEMYQEFAEKTGGKTVTGVWDFVRNGAFYGIRYLRAC